MGARLMPLRDPDALLDLIDAHQRITRRAGYRIADAGVDRLERNVKRRTPIDTNPYRHRPERPRGSLRADVHREGPVVLIVRAGRERYEGEVLTYDPIARYVENDTPPHRIHARRPGGRLLFQSRYGFTGRDGRSYPPGTWVSVEEVNHPGTKGQHMFSLGAWATEREYASYAAEPLQRWKREVESVHT
jgi:hypothetical protein